MCNNDKRRIDMDINKGKIGAVVALAAGAMLSGALWAQQPIKIGYAADISGVCGPLVDGATKGFRLGVEELNKAGGLIGRKIEVIERDTKSRPDEGAKEVRDLIVNEKVDVITGVCSSAVLLAETAVSGEFKVPLYAAIGATQTANIEKWQPYFWQTQANALMEAVAAAEYVARNKGWKKIVPLAYDYEWGHTTVKAFAAHLKKLRPDVEITELVPVKLGETNLTSYITAVLAQKPDAVFGAIFGGGLVNLVKQGKSFGFFQQTNLVTLTTVDFLQSMGADMPDRGMSGFSRAPFYALLGNPKAKAFADAYKARYDKDPDDWAMLAYDGLMFYAAAVRQAKSAGADAVMKAVTSIKYAGLRGTMTVRALDGQMNAPEWVGTVGKDPKYPYMVLKDIVRIDADKTMPTEAAIKAGRAAAK
jgi:branched-chain amino acid transport system substrate-binding protein